MSGAKPEALAVAELAELEAEIYAAPPDRRPCAGCSSERAAGVRLDELEHVECAAALSRVGEGR